MLLFFCASQEQLKTIRRQGLPPSDEGVLLHADLVEARAHCHDGRVLVLNALHPDLRPLPPDDLSVEILFRRAVPPEAFLNLDPWRPPVPVTAAGGYVLREAGSEPDLLLIYRRGVWDLPKGKCDRGESPEACALREVREEIGIDRVEVVRSLGCTRHGYVEGERYSVKTTHWFWMQTPETRFTPEREENIERVEWVPWSEATRRLGYETLRRHMARVERSVIGNP